MHWKEDNGIVTLLGSPSVSVERRADGGAGLLLFIGGVPNYGPWVARCGIFEMDPDYDDHCGCGWDLSLTKTNTGREGGLCIILMWIHDKSHSCAMQRMQNGKESRYILAVRRPPIRPPSRYARPSMSEQGSLTDRPTYGRTDRPSLSAFSSLCSV